LYFAIWLKFSYKQLTLQTVKPISEYKMAANFKDPSLLLGVANTAGLIGVFIYLSKQISELNSKYDALFQKIGGGDGKLYDAITQRTMQAFPQHNSQTQASLTAASKQLKKLKKQNVELEQTLAALIELLSNVDLAKMSDKDLKDFKENLSGLGEEKSQKRPKKKTTKKTVKKHPKKPEPESSSESSESSSDDDIMNPKK
jgi:hypothetical protein